MALPSGRRADGKGRCVMGVLNVELKRVMKARMTWVLLALALLLSAVLAYLPVTYCSSTYLDENGEEITVTGRASITYEKARQADTAGPVTPERVRAALERYHACLRKYGVTESYDLPEGVYEREILPIAPLLHGIKEAFADPNTGMAPSLLEIQPEEIDRFDAVCEARLVSLMRTEQPDSPAAQKKALEMYREVEKPFTVCPGACSTVMDYQNIVGFLVLLFCTVLAAPVFSGEYQSGADDILRCTKHGRGRLGTARVIAALCVSGGTFLICSGVYLLLSNALFGWDTTGASMQMIYSILSLVEMDLGGLQWFFVLAGLLSVLASVSVALFLSAKCRSTVTALGCALVLCIAPVMIYMTVPGAAADWLCTLLPASGVGIQTSILYALTDFRFLNLGGLTLWVPYGMLLAWVIEIPLFFILTVRGYCKTVR